MGTKDIIHGQDLHRPRRQVPTAISGLAVLFAVLLVLALAAVVRADPPLPTIPANTFTITSFGAIGDGTTDNAGSIQNAINAAATAGGGTVVVAAVGVLTNYLSGPINLSNNVCLQINSGAMLQMLPMSTWVSNFGTTTFINGSKLHDVEINGSGTIDGQGTNWWFPLASGRPNLINFSGCTNILIQNVTLRNPPTFHIMVKGNNVNLTIQGITENTPFDSHNTDGMDLASTNVLIRNCSISVGDDNIEIGGSGGAAANITVSNCVFGSGHGVSIGSLIATQLVGDVRGVHDLIVSNCSFSGTDNGIRMKTDRDRGGVCQNLKYLDLTMTNVANPIIIYGYYDSIGTPTNITPFQASTDTVQTVTGSTPVWRNITISNLTASADSGHGVVGILWSVPEMLISNVTFYNVHFTAPKTFCIYNAQAIRFIDSQIAAPSSTNTLTLYNADITVTNSAANANLVTLGGLAIPPTNNTLAFFNAQAAITDTNMLGTGPITLGGATLTVAQDSASFSNNISCVSASSLAMTSGTNVFGGLLSGPGPLTLNVPTNTVLTLVRGILGFPTALTIAGGTVALSSNLVVGVDLTTTGSVTITSGQLLVSNASTYLGSNGVGQLTLSNGMWLAADVNLGNGTGSQGTLTVAGGTSEVSSFLSVGNSANATGAVWLTGGQLIKTNFTGGVSAIGFSGVGQMTVSNGVWVGRGGDVMVGYGAGSQGTLTIAGGTNTLIEPGYGMYVGDVASATGTVWLTGGLVTTTNGNTYIGDNGTGQMTISNGTWRASNVLVGVVSGARGTLTQAGGTVSVYGSLTVGRCGPMATGIVTLNGGSLFITNAAHNATLNIIGGTFTLSSGTLMVDEFVMTNSCGHFVHTGGTLIYTSAVLDPNRDDDGDGIPNGYEQSHGLDPLNTADANADNDGDGFSNLQEYLAGTDPNSSTSSFRIASLVTTGYDLRVTWTMGSGKTNALQRTAGDGGGNYGTNNFANIFIVTNTVGTVTNFLDVGGATNKPARYYRIRLVP